MANPNAAPTGYAEIILVLERLPMLVQEKRRRHELSVREAARRVGVSFVTVARCEAGEDMVLSNAVKFLEWVRAS